MAQFKLTATGISKIRKPGMYGDGGNLYLQVTKSGKRKTISKSWIFRYRPPGSKKTREMGLGPLQLVSLGEAREKALAARRLLFAGRDPLVARVQDRAKATTFAECADRYINAQEAGWKNDKHRQQWRQTMDVACATLGELPVASIDTGLVLKVLEPLWKAKPETASRLRGRIEKVLDWATVRGYRSGDNPARWRGHLQHMLQTAKRTKRHFAAMPYAEIGSFMVELRQREGVDARALEFLILTAARTGEVIGAKWPEIEGRVWTIPASRMKAGKEHKVPLSSRAYDIARAIPHEADFVFSAGGKALGSLAMLSLLKTMRPNLTTHGFRSCFMDWAHDTTSYPKVVIDMALAHSVGDKVEASYRRGDLFEKRRKLMAEWERFCAKPVADADVIPMRRG